MNDLDQVIYLLNDVEVDAGRIEYARKQAGLLAEISQARAGEDLVIIHRELVAVLVKISNTLDAIADSVKKD